MAKVKLSDVAREYKENIKGKTSGMIKVGLEHLDSGSVLLKTWEEVGETTFTKVFKKGHVLFGRRRAYLKKAVVAPCDGICSGDIIVIEAIPGKIEPNLLPFIIQNDDLFDYAIGKSAGSLSPRVKWENLCKYEFELPELDKQKEIADLLWAANDTKEAYKKLLSMTEELLKSQFTVMFANVKKHTYTIEQISVRGPQNGFYRKGAEINPNTPIIKMKQLFGNESMADAIDIESVNMNEKEISNFKLTPNDLLFGRRSLVIEGAGKCRRAGDINDIITFESSLLRITLNANLVLPRYLQSWFESQEGINAIERIRTVTTISGITGTDLRKIKVPIPSIDLQQQYINTLEQADKSKIELQQTLQNLENIIKALVCTNLR